MKSVIVQLPRAPLIDVSGLLVWNEMLGADPSTTLECRYYWLCNAVDAYCPVQWEYSRLNVS
jgi:hypothetical protein